MMRTKKSNNTKNLKGKISKEMLIADITEHYPEVMEYLVSEYNLHCFGCFMSAYETLEDGAKVHGIEGKEFEKLLDKANKMIESK